MHDGRSRIQLSVPGTIIALVIVLGTGFAGGYEVARHVAAASLMGSSDSTIPQDVDFSPVWMAWNVINEKFVPAAVATSTPLATTTAALDQQKVFGMISGLASSLNDPYTYFLPPTQNQQFSQDMSGSFEGIGMQIEIKSGVLTVISPLKGTPAERAGIKAGDEILQINGVSTQGMDTDTAVQRIRGPRGTQVTLTVLREGWDAPRDIKVTRDVINVPEVEATARPDGVFVISIATFTANSPDLFRNALREFVQSGDSKLVLDLRGNPGGYLDAAVDIASWYLPAGKVIVTEDYAGHADSIVHRSYGYDIFNSNLKMVVLVDKGSASASEILSDALHYYGVAKLVGTQTYGKGSVQELVSITPDTTLKLTVARWLGPDGKQIPRTGIIPDVIATTTDAAVQTGQDPQLEKAVQVLNSM
jgi:carboxyl-terminal processing protease